MWYQRMFESKVKGLEVVLGGFTLSSKLWRDFEVGRVWHLLGVLMRCGRGG